METLWELTRGIANITNSLLGRVGTLEAGARSQEGRLDALEDKRKPNFHSMETEQESKLQREEGRQSNLSDGELRQELNEQYGAGKWAKRLIDTLLLKRRRKSEN